MTVNRPAKRRLAKALGAVGAAAAVALGTSVPAQRLLAFPSAVHTTQGHDLLLPWSRWLPISVAGSSAQAGLVDGAEKIDVHAPNAGHFLLRLRLFGRIPWRGVPVEVTKPVYVVPGGESVGVLAHTRGLMVTGLSPVDAGGRVSDPAAEAGIERGDVITEVDGQPAASVKALEQRVARDGSQHRLVRLLVEGSRSNRQRQVAPVWSARTHSWHIGAHVQDRTSGVGTITFFNPGNYRFTALGHSVSDGLTRRPVGLAAGTVTGAEIVGLVPATDNQPGQKVGVLAGPDNISGAAGFNGMFGIVGQLDHPPLWGPHRALPLAYPDQVHDGPAQILTVLHGQMPEIYHIEIVKTAAQYEPQVKGLLFKVTDPRLLKQTGGIIQGMSGSPIIQNGRVVGAVTHVLVNRPTLGFGCYPFWMAQQPAYRS